MDYYPTELAFRELFSSARSEILLCSPFAEFNGLIRFTEVFAARLTSGCKLLFLSRQVSPQDRGSRFQQIQQFLDLLASRGTPLDAVEVRNYHFSDQARVESSSHAKLIVVDGKRAYLGSADVRANSLDRNFEVGMIVTGRPAVELRRVFLAMFADAAPVRGVRRANA
jgi:phosphatidylserine/phosphatidylglycerophosphate/cardiolipin synthase-like enzyme